MSETNKTYALDVDNRHAVGVCGDRVTVMLPSRSMTREQAVVHAAWLVAMADLAFPLTTAPEFDAEAAFREALAKVRST